MYFNPNGLNWQGFILALFCDLKTLLKTMSEKKLTIQELLKNPTVYHKKRVIVEGFFVHEFENQSLWDSPEASVESDFNASIWLDINKKTAFFSQQLKKAYSFSGRHVLVKGTFLCEPATSKPPLFGYGHMGAWPAELQNVTLIQALRWNNFIQVF